MTDKQRLSLVNYVGRLADALGLGEWHLVLHYDSADAGNAAEVSVVPGRRTAHISLSEDFPTFDPEEQRHVLVHELIHIHLDRIRTYARDTLPEVMGRPAWAAWHVTERDLNEYATDALAAAFAPHMPLWSGK